MSHFSVFLLITAALGPEPTLVTTVAPRQLGVGPHTGHFLPWVSLWRMDVV